MPAKRKSRAGTYAHPSGIYVRSKRPAPPRENLELEAGAVTHHTKAAVTLPKLKWMEREIPE